MNVARITPFACAVAHTILGYVIDAMRGTIHTMHLHRLLPLIAVLLLVVVAILPFAVPVEQPTVMSLSQPVEHIRAAATSTPTPMTAAVATTTQMPPQVVPVSEIQPTTPTPATSVPVSVTSASEPMSASAAMFGISFADTLTGLSSQKLGSQLDDTRALGAGWIRIDLDWGIIGRAGEGKYDWSRVDRVVAAAHARDLQILALLVYTPEWARPEGCDSPRCPPYDPALFARFAADAAARYAPKGVHAWQIWNEPNARASWLPAADAAAYAALLRPTATALRTEDSEALIVSAGLAPAATENGNIAPREYLSRLYASGARDSFDAVGFHPYGFPALPSYMRDWNAWSQMSATSPSIRSIMIAHGDAHKKVWLTEFGAPTGGPGAMATLENYKTVRRSDHVDEAMQVQIALDALALMAGYDWVGPLFWYSYQDLGTSPSTKENFFGLLRHDGTPKPAYTVLKNNAAL